VTGKLACFSRVIVFISENCLSKRVFKEDFRGFFSSWHFCYHDSKVICAMLKAVLNDFKLTKMQLKISPVGFSKLCAVFQNGKILPLYKHLAL
jgi:hypothetical protein